MALTDPLTKVKEGIESAVDTVRVGTAIGQDTRALVERYGGRRSFDLRPSDLPPIEFQTGNAIRRAESRGVLGRGVELEHGARAGGPNSFYPSVIQIEQATQQVVQPDLSRFSLLQPPPSPEPTRQGNQVTINPNTCLLYTSPSPRDS